MAVIWADERLTSAELARDLEIQRLHWLETASAFDRLKSNLAEPSALQYADDYARSCRLRADKLERLIRQMR